MHNRPKYICFEGLDGSGKTTLLKKIVKALKEHNYTFYELSPTQKCGDNDIFEKIFNKFSFLKDILFFRQFLYAHRSNVVAKNINWNVDIIVGDRSVITSYVCRWSKSESFNKRLITRVNFLENKIPAPDDVIYLDVTHENLKKRKNKRGTTDIDENDKRSLEMRYAYDYIMNNPKAILRLENVKWHIIDGNLSEEEVFNNAWKKLMDIIQESKN